MHLYIVKPADTTNGKDDLEGDHRFEVQSMATTHNAESEKVKRSIELPAEHWNALASDAKRTRRSINGVLTALLDLIYFEADVELHRHQPAIERAIAASPTAQDQERMRSKTRKTA